MSTALTQSDLPVLAPYDGETAKQFAGRRAFLELGGARSLLSAYNSVRLTDGREPVTSAPGSWRRWAAKWRWEEAARSYDARVAEIALAGIATGVLEARLAVAGVSKAMLDKLRQRVEQLDPSAIPAGAVAGLLREAVSALFRSVGYDPRALVRIETSEPVPSGVLLLPAEWSMEEMEARSREWHTAQAAAQTLEDGSTPE